MKHFWVDCDMSFEIEAENEEQAEELFWSKIRSSLPDSEFVEITCIEEKNQPAEFDPKACGFMSPDEFKDFVGRNC